MSNLSEHFTLEELSFSEVATRKGMDNTPGLFQTENLVRLCETILEPVRQILGAPMHINSGYRAPAVNTLIGGAPDSAHCDGRAADFVPIALPLRNVFDALRTSADLPYDQIIFECDAWIHVAIAPDGRLPRREALTATGHAGDWHYVRVA